jgi:hypothetical protein
VSFIRRFGGEGKPPEDETEAILKKHLDQDFRVFPMAERRSMPSEVEAIGQRFGVRYPPQFISHVCGKFPGVYVEIKEEVWPRPKPYDVEPFWSFLYALHSYTAAAQSEEWMRLDAAAELFRTRTDLLAAPILRVVRDADLYCVNAQAHLCQWHHETNELEPIDIDFWDLFEREVANLHDRKVKKTSL